jgi:hypothetical protein
MDGSDADSIHNEEDIPPAPPGWIGGDLVHTGGGIYAREWVHTAKGIRVGYATSEPDAVTVDEVKFDGDGDEANVLNWQYVSTREEIRCEGEEKCLQAAVEAMVDLSEN